MSKQIYRDEALVLSWFVQAVSSIARGVVSTADVRGRIKTLRSRTRKARQKGIVLDGLGVRVIVESAAECYRVMDRIHERFEILPHEYDDYIEYPKVNGYRSLHTTIRASNGHSVEIQVRTRGMHCVAEVGSAAHASYKQSSAIETSLSDGGMLSQWLPN